MIEPCYITGEMDPDFAEAVRLGAETGIRTVQLRQNIFGRNIEELTDGEAQRAKAVLAEYGVRVGSLYSPFGKCDIEDAGQVGRHMEMLARVIELARVFETPFVRVFPLRRPGFAEYEPSRLEHYLPLITEKLGAAVRLAEAAGVRLCLETVGSTLAMSARDIRRVVDALDPSPAVGLVWEIDVASRRGESVAAGYPHIRDGVVDVHVKANARGAVDPIDGGMGTYEEAFRLLHADGYEGFATVEHWPGSEGTLSGLRQLRAILERVTGRGEQA